MDARITDKKTIGEKFGDKRLMEKKPVNKGKYSGVEKVIDTGKTIKDVQFLSDQLVSKRKTEMFKRIKASTIIKLIQENKTTESIYKLVEESDSTANAVVNKNINNDAVTISSVVGKPDGSVVSAKTNKTDLTTKTTVTAITFATEMLGNLAEIDFIILDLRETSEYEQFHIREAISYPGVSIARDKFLTSMITMKNKDGKMIIIYGNDERSSIPYGTLLIQKGYDNIFFLSGGIEEFAKVYPEFCEGTGVQQLINAKILYDNAQKEALLKKTGMLKKGYLKDTKKKQLENNKSKTVEKTLMSKDDAKVLTSNSAINKLKQNLQK